MDSTHARPLALRLGTASVCTAFAVAQAWRGARGRRCSAWAAWALVGEALE